MLDKIKALCSAKGKTLKQVEMDAGIAPNTIFRWNSTDPGISKVRHVADALGVTVNDLLDYPTNPQQEAERRVMGLFLALNEEGQAAALSYLEFLQRNPAYIKSNSNLAGGVA